jgi:MYXO-CTERM domain-containing protein
MMIICHVFFLSVPHVMQAPAYPSTNRRTDWLWAAAVVLWSWGRRRRRLVVVVVVVVVTVVVVRGLYV